MAKRFNLTPRALQDLRSIWRYTLDVWGESQADRYLSEIYERIHWLTEHSQMGTQRPDIGEGYYCFPQGSHLVFYLCSEDAIDVIGILHKQMDVLHYFDGD